MKKKTKDKKISQPLSDKQYLFLKILFVGSFFLIGGFHEFVACLYSCVELIYLFYLMRKNKSLNIYNNLNFILLVFIIIMYLFSVLYAVDRGMAIIGFVDMLSIVLFALIIMQLSKQQRQGLLLLIPKCGVVMVAAGGLSFFTNIVYEFFYVSNRLGGFFQYPNTLALFLLLGVIVLYYNRTSTKKDYFQSFILLFGILITGSRTVYLITAAYLIYFSIKDRQILKIVIGSLGGVIVLGLLVSFIGVEIGIYERISSINLSSSTFIGRLLYYKDGLRALVNHPLGLGYLGYYFIEPQIQTGIYSVRFIHNDILQLALDVGIIPAIMFISILVTSFISNRTSKENKLILLAIVLHSLLDFSLQYKSIFFVLIIVLDLYGPKSEKSKSNLLILKYTSLIAGILVSGYFAVAISLHYFGLTDLSIKMLPIYSEAKINKLVNSQDINEGVKLANEILDLNNKIAVCYDVLAVNEYNQGNYDKMIEYKEQSIELQKYNINVYDTYLSQLSIAIDYNKKDAKKYIQKALDVEIKLKTIENQTDALAYKIADKPSFELSTSSKKILKMLGGEQ